jgi:hypothetical protein
MSYFRIMASSIISLCLIFIGAYTVQKFQFNIHTKLPTIPLEDEQEIFAANVAKLIDYINAKGYHVTVGEAYRTEQQAMIYAHEGLGIVNSLHRKRLAIDLNIFTADNKLLQQVKDLEVFGKYWESLHSKNRWGGNFKTRPDSDHFQMKV